MTVDVPVAETLARHSPLEAYAERFGASPLDLAEEPYVTQLLLRTDPHAAAATAVEDLLGESLPVANAASNPAGPRTVIWLGPDEWLITVADGPADLAGQLAEVVRAVDGAVLDVSAQRTTIRLRGPHAREVLAKGCAVDLHPRVVRHHLAQQTMLAHAGVILVVLDPGAPELGLAADLDVRLLVRSTFAAYLADWLLDAALEYTG